ncbi:MAG: glycosyltransferase family 2 protein [Candidatus Omnitrophica bacterium]|nr:glycosyltransferase family 2 protein [Candidatus Omnitrophota bacterium]
MNICILIPVHNEARTIAEIVRRLKQLKYSVLVVDDGSKDNSGSMAEGQGAEVLRNDGQKGKGASLRRGFAYALEKNYDGVIMMDGDGQHNIGDIPKFIEEAKRYPKVIVVGNRMTNAKGMPFVRYLTNRFMSLLISSACWQYIPDTQCGYRYISPSALKELKLSSDSFEIETEILMKARKKKIKISSVPIETIYEDEKSKINPLIDTLRFFIYFIKELFSF